MPRAMDQVEQLRTRQEEVEDLGDEKEDERLRKMALNGDCREGHAGEIAECVARKRSCGIPTVMST